LWQPGSEEPAPKGTSYPPEEDGGGEKVRKKREQEREIDAGRDRRQGAVGRGRPIGPGRGGQNAWTRRAGIVSEQSRRASAARRGRPPGEPRERSNRTHAWGSAEQDEEGASSRRPQNRSQEEEGRSVMQGQGTPGASGNSASKEGQNKPARKGGQADQDGKTEEGGSQAKTGEESELAGRQQRGPVNGQPEAGHRPTQHQYASTETKGGAWRAKAGQRRRTGWAER